MFFFYFSLSAPKNCKLAMHIFGLLTTASSIVEFDEMLLSCTVIFSSPCSSENAEKRFNNIQTLLTSSGESAFDDSSIVPEDLEVHSELWTIMYLLMSSVSGFICRALFVFYSILFIYLLFKCSMLWQGEAVWTISEQQILNKNGD